MGTLNIESDAVRTDSINVFNINTFEQQTFYDFPSVFYFNDYDTLYLTASPKDGCTFYQWTFNSSSSVNNPLEISWTGDNTITAVFTGSPTPPPTPPVYPPTRLFNFVGTMFSGKITDITTQNNTKNALIKINGADKDVVQKLGKNNRIFTLEGYVTGSADVQFLNNSLNYTGSIYYTSSSLHMELIGTASAYVMIYFSKLIWQDDGKSPMARKFSLELIEVKK